VFENKVPRKYSDLGRIIWLNIRILSRLVLLIRWKRDYCEIGISWMEKQGKRSVFLWENHLETESSTDWDGRTTLRWINFCWEDNITSIHSLIHQRHYSLLLGPGLFFSFVIFLTQTVALLGRWISPSQGRYLHTGQHKHRHLCREWNSNPRSHLSSERIQSMP
jgi:hypothetical protein